MATLEGMKSQAFNPVELDVAAFAKQASELSGEWPLQDLQRLAATVLPEAHKSVSWHLRGELRAARGDASQVWLHVTARTEVTMECQRCLKPVEIPVSIERAVMFVHGESTAAELDLESEDDILALNRALDARNLIEDELLLALPLVPRHEACPQPLQAPSESAAAETDRQPNPFAAALASFKARGLPN